MPNFEQFMQAAEKNPAQKAAEFRAEKLVLEDELAELERQDSGNPEISFKKEKIQELEGMIERLEAEDVSADAEEIEGQDRKAA